MYSFAREPRINSGKKTVVYYVRHARPNYDNHNDMERELTAQGLRDRLRAARLLENVHVDAVLSSPFRRAVETVQPIADARGLSVIIVDDLRERRIDSCWIDDFDSFCKRQWEDFDYRLNDGECLREVQKRNIAALEDILRRFKGSTVVIGGHGTAMSTIINHYDPSFGFAGFSSVRRVTPLVVRMEFAGVECVSIERLELPV